MNPGLILGLGIFVLAGIAGGTVALPQKYVKTFAWENTWGTFWFLSMIVFPAAVIPFCVNDIGAVWSEAGAQTVVIPFVFGLLWGVGCVTYGAVVHMVGLSLGISLIMGTILAVGSLIPLAVLHTQKLATLAGLVILLGVAVSLVGVAMVGYAGMLKSRALEEQGQSEQTPGRQRASMTVAILVAILSGITSSGLNLGFAFSSEIPQIAAEHGAPVWVAQLASWQLVLWGGFVTCGAFSTVLLIRNRTWKNFARPGAGRDTGLASVMAVLNFSTLLLYGLGAHFIGDLGTSLGFAAFTSIAIIVANLLGFVTGEWKGAGTKPVCWIIASTVVLVIAVCVLGLGNSL